MDLAGFSYLNLCHIIGNKLVNNIQILPDPACPDFYVLAMLCVLAAALSIQGASIGFPASTGFLQSGYIAVAF